MDIKSMNKLAAKGKMSRRDFVQLAMAAGITAATAQTMFAKAARAEPKKGGRFRMALGSGATTDTLDPATFPDTFNGVYGWGSLRSSLTEVTPEGKVIPDLAESFEASKDAKTWVFTLRNGTQFHSGKSVDADDVVASINHHRAPESKSAAKSLLTTVADVKADGKNKVVITLNEGNADFPFVISDYHMPIMPAKDGKADWQSGDGTGPYVMGRYQPGVSAEGKRFANYHRETYFDEIEIKAITDVVARSNALSSGDVDYIDRVDIKTVDMMARAGTVDISEVAGFAHYVAPMNCTVAPFDNVDVRLALKYAIDREEIVKKVLRGHGSVGNDNPIASGVPYHKDPKIKHSYDPEKVKFHLKKAGLTSLKVDLSTSDAAFAGAVDAASLMKESAAKCGIDINVIQEAGDAYWDAVWMKKPWCMSYWSGRPTPDLMFSTAYAADAAWNDSFWKNDQFNKLLVAGRGELDQKKRADIYGEMQDIVAEDGGVAVLMFYNYMNACAKTVAHPDVIAPNWDVDGMKITQRWWFA
jgi:peptide/nickel transport system substrate-binding protein